MFDAAIDVCNGEAAVQLEGELDIATLPVLEGVVKGLADAGASSLVFDCTDIASVDSTTGRRIAALTRGAASVGVDLAVCNLPRGDRDLGGP